MKKGYLVLILLLSLIIVGCGKSSEKESKETKKESYSISYEDVDITPGVEFNADNIKAQAKISEVPSCAFEGSDTVYTYDDLEITVANKDNKKIVYSVYFLSPNIKTKEGVSIDSTKEELIKAYGENSNADNDIVYTKGDVDLKFIVNDNVITSIEYVLKTDK